MKQKKSMYLTHIDLKFLIGGSIQWETSSFAPLNLAALIIAAVKGIFDKKSANFE